MSESVGLNEARLARYAESIGSPGIWVPSNGSAIVNMPGGRVESAALKVLNSFGLKVQVRSTKVDGAILGALRSAVDLLTDKGRNGSSAMSEYLPETDTLRFTSDAPFADIHRALSNMPVEVEIVNQPIVGQAGARNADTSAHYGGAAIMSPTQGPCSAAYSVSLANGTKGAITPAHCFSLGQTISSESGGSAWGSVVYRNGVSMDVAVVQGAGATFAGRVWAGGPISSASFRVSGAGWIGPFAGETGLCRSARSGTFCGNSVTSVGSYTCYSGVCSTVFTYVSTVGNLSVPGDSGGAVFMPRTVARFPGETIAEIRGMHTAISGSTMVGVWYGDISNSMYGYWGGPTIQMNG